MVNPAADERSARKMSEFLLLLHEPKEGFGDYSPEEMQAVIEKYQAWAMGLAEQDKIVESRKLKDDGGRKVHRGLRALLPRRDAR